MVESITIVGQTLQSAVYAALLVLTGAALSLSVWVIPVIQLSPTSKAKATQLTYTVTLGGRYLQSSFRACAAAILLLTILAYNNVDAGLPSWTVFASALGVLLPAAVYEVYFMFPINDSLKEWQDELVRRRQDNFEDSKDKEVDRKLKLWQQRQAVRIVVPFMAALLLRS